MATYIKSTARRRDVQTQIEAALWAWKDGDLDYSTRACLLEAVENITAGARGEEGRRYVLPPTDDLELEYHGTTDAPLEP